MHSVKQIVDFVVRRFNQLHSASLVQHDTGLFRKQEGKQVYVDMYVVLQMVLHLVMSHSHLKFYLDRLHLIYAIITQPIILG